MLNDNTPHSSAAGPTEIITDAEWDAALARELDALGLTLDELAEQAAACRFVSERARRVWFVFAAASS